MSEHGHELRRQDSGDGISNDALRSVERVAAEYGRMVDMMAPESSSSSRYEGNHLHRTHHHGYVLVFAGGIPCSYLGEFRRRAFFTPDSEEDPTTRRRIDLEIGPTLAMTYLPGGDNSQRIRMTLEEIDVGAADYRATPIEQIDPELEPPEIRVGTIPIPEND